MFKFINNKIYLNKYLERSANDKISIIAVGDMVFDREVGNIIQEKGPRYPFEKVTDTLHAGDIVFGNLEGPFAEYRTRPAFDKRISFCAKPICVEGLAYAGFNLLNIANNHIMDHGSAALYHTMSLLDRFNIRYAGAGKNLADARRPAFFNINNVNIAWLCYASKDIQTNATINSPGTAPFIADLVNEDIKNIKQNTDYIIISVHKGREFVYYPEPSHQKDCRRLIDEGADIILGHHSHFPQGIEIYKNKPIIYSLGEFISDFEPPITKYEQSLFLKTRQNCFISKINLCKKSLISIEIIPKIQNTNFQAEIASGDATDESSKFIRRISAPLNQPDLNKIFWKKAKNYLFCQTTCMLSRIKTTGFKQIFQLIGWISSDYVLRMLFGSFLKLEPPDYILKFKRMLFNVYKKLKRYAIN